MTLPETYRSQVQHIQQSPKFQKRPEGGRQAVPFVGYTVITPAEEESQNFALYKNLPANSNFATSSGLRLMCLYLVFILRWRT